jgi:hypothetical protein
VDEDSRSLNTKQINSEAEKKYMYKPFDESARPIKETDLHKK